MSNPAVYLFDTKRESLKTRTIVRAHSLPQVVGLVLEEMSDIEYVQVAMIYEELVYKLLEAAEKES